VILCLHERLLINWFSKSTDSSWTWRSCSIGTFDLDLKPIGSWTGTWWNSLSTKVTNNSISGDYLWGSLYVGTGWYPTNWVSYFSADVDVHRDINDKGKFNWLNFTVEAASGFIASAYIGLRETRPDGSIVRTVEFNQIIPSLNWDYDAVASAQRSNPQEGIYVGVYNGHTAGGLQIQLTYVFTNKAGILDLEIPVTVVPEGVESFLTVSGWNYADTNNTLSFLMVTGSRKASFSASGVLSAGTGRDRTFFRLADSCLVGGVVKDTTVSWTVSKAGLIDFQNPSVRAQLEAKYKADVQVTFWTVTFPPGADLITYDPSVGTGADPWSETKNVGLIVGLTIIAFVLFIGALVGLYYVFSKRIDYENVK